MSSPTNNDAFKLSELFNVKDKVVVVSGWSRLFHKQLHSADRSSGGGSGIGLMATQAFAVNGAKVYIIGRTKEKLEKVAEQYGKDVPGQIIPLVGDISKKESIAEIIKEIESKEKCVCILVNK